jgi:hypothetical protein
VVARPWRALASWWAGAERVRRAAREPLVHFVLLGAVLLAIARGYEARTNLYRIEVTPAHVAEVARRYALQYGAPPEKAVLEQLVEDDIHDEILYRQGKALRLDQDDEIVRRRVVQKSQFLLEDLQAPPEPTDRQLSDYYAAHADRYAAPARASFTHIFFADERGGEGRAKAELASLPAGLTRAPDRGDPFPDLYDFEGYDAEQVARLFGHTPLADAVFSAPPGRWVGPVRSAYGWHLLYVSGRAPPRRPPLQEVRDRVRADYLQAAQGAANAAAFKRLAGRFTVVRRDQGAGR